MAFVFALAAIGARGQARAAETLEVTLELGGGSDGGLFRLAEGPLTAGSTDDDFVLARPDVSATFSSAEQLTRLTYVGSFRDYALSTNGRSFAHQLGLEHARDFGAWLTLEGGVAAAFEDFTRVESDYRALAAHAGPRLRVGDGLQIGLMGEGQLLASAGVESRFAGVAGDVAWTTGRVELGARASARVGNDAYRQVSGGVSAGATLGALQVNGELSAGALREGPWLGWGGGVRVALGETWSVRGNYRGSRERYDAGAALFAHEVLLGVGVRWELGDPGLRELLAKAQAEALHEDARGVVVVVRVDRAAQRVALVGDFNGWEPAGLPLARRGDGSWEVRLDLAPGRYSYQLSIDGELRTPGGATAYSSDDFGGTNAVLIAPSGVGEELTCCS